MHELQTGSPSSRRSTIGHDIYLYVARGCSTRNFASRSQRANEVLDDYRALLERSRVNQLRFNGALLLGALIIVGLAILTALEAGRPAGSPGRAAGRRRRTDRGGRFLEPACRSPKTEDEIADARPRAFNRMTGRLEEQTGALMAANTQLDTRRAFIEAVLSSVTAGVIALDANKRILLINRSAETLLQQERGDARRRVAGRGFARTRRVHARRTARGRCARRVRVRAADAGGQARALSATVRC